MIHNDGFINAMNATCKMMSASAIVDGIEYSEENIVSVNPYYEGSLLCSVMRCCAIEIRFDEEIDSSKATALRGKTVNSVKIGAKQENDDDFYFIEYGKYKVYEAEYREANNSAYLTCYDSMLDAMIPYNIEVSGAMTVKSFLQLICNKLGWTLANVSFANENVSIPAGALNSYLPIVTVDEETGESTTENNTFTFRDVLDDIAELIGGNLIFKADGLLYPLYPETITEGDELVKLSADKQIEISFYDQFGPINSVSLVDSENADTVTLDDKESIAKNGDCQITIKDNPLINSNREGLISGIFNKLRGLYYTPYDFTSFGFGYIEFGDIFNIEDRKGNVKRGIMLSDSFLASMNIQEISSAKAYSPDSDTEYSVATPVDKVKVEIKRLQNANGTLNQRLADAQAYISKTTKGHAVLVDLEYNSKTGKYYVGNGEADTFVVSENPSIATADETKDWNTGRVIRINYNGIAISTEGIAGPYSDFAVYYDETLKKYCVNADDIAVGTLQGIKAILKEGVIGGYNINENQLTTSWTESNGKEYEFKIKQAFDDKDEKTYDDNFVQMLSAKDEGEYRYLLYKDGTVEASSLVSNENILVNGTVYGISSNVLIKGFYGDYGVVIGKDTTRLLDGTIRSSIESARGSLCIGSNSTIYSFANGFRWTIDNDTDKAIVFNTNSYFRPYTTEKIYLGASSYRWKTVYCTAFNESSDLKLKEDISPITDCDELKDFFMNVQPIFYKLKNGEGKRTHMGFGAQPLAETAKKYIGDLSVFQASVVDDEGNESYFNDAVDDKNLSWGLCYTELIAPLWAMVQQQQKQIDVLEEKMQKLEAKLNDTN